MSGLNGQFNARLQRVEAEEKRTDMILGGMLSKNFVTAQNSVPPLIYGAYKDGILYISKSQNIYPTCALYGAHYDSPNNRIRLRYFLGVSSMLTRRRVIYRIFKPGNVSTPLLFTDTDAVGPTNIAYYLSTTGDIVNVDSNKFDESGVTTLRLCTIEYDDADNIIAILYSDQITIKVTEGAITKYVVRKFSDNTTPHITGVYIVESLSTNYMPVANNYSVDTLSGLESNKLYNIVMTSNVKNSITISSALIKT